MIVLTGTRTRRAKAAFSALAPVFVCLAMFPGHAQEEASSTADDSGASASTGDAAVPDMLDAQSFLYERIQRLENALWALTGKVEELEYELDALSSQQLNSYRDLDRRILDLGRSGVTSAPEETALPEGDSEEDLYRRAFGLLKKQEYSDSLTTFEALSEKYPNGKHVAESWYWQGELHLKAESPDLEAARQKFVQLLTWYPADERAAQAMFKLGAVYQQLGDESKSKEYLLRVVDEYPESNVANIAREYYRQFYAEAEAE